MAKKYYWIRLKTDFFKSLAMKKLRRIAGGDTYTIIYLKLQLLSADTEGILYYEGIENSFAEEIASLLDEDEENVKITLQFLTSVGLLEQKSADEYLLTEVPFIVGSETDKAQLMRNKRAREKQNLIESGNNVTSVLPPVTECYTEREKRESREREEKRENRVDYELIARMYNDTCVSFPRVTTLSDARKKAIKARLNKYTIEDLQRAFELAEASDFLKGNNGRNWSANFDWIIKDTNIAKILDGNYNNKASQRSSNSTAEELNDFYNMASNWANS